ncbi:MAG: hypothetical protein JXN65_09445 [Clostridia bacterium]|nr:hypothetical protein [Clostridia bacterium]
MNEKKEQPKKNSRLDKFLFYAKFAILIIVAALFTIAYSLSYREFPSSTAQHKFAERSTEIPSDEDTEYPPINVLIVIGYSENYSDIAYADFNYVKSITENIENISYDIFILNENSNNSSILQNITDSMILRLYENKTYQYIISIGDSAIYSSEEIRDLFFPAAKLLVFSASSGAVYDALVPVNSKEDMIIKTIETAEKVNPLAESILLIGDNADYSSTVIQTAEAYIKTTGLSSYAMRSDEYSLESIAEYIKSKGNRVSVIYVSYTDETYDDSNGQADAINKLYDETGALIFDLSPFKISEESKASIRYWQDFKAEEPLAYLALTPENTASYNYELIELAAANIPITEEVSLSSSKYASTSAFFSWCMANMGYYDFPVSAEKQMEFCKENELMTEAENLSPGDIIFIAAGSENPVDSRLETAIYIEEGLVIYTNKNGLLCFTNPPENNLIIAYASPYSLFDHKSAD